MEKILYTEYGNIHYWISDVVDKTKETIILCMV